MLTIARGIRKWWPGLIPLGLLWVWACWVSTVPWQQDLAQRADTALKSTVLDQTVIEVSGRDITLSAKAFSESGRRIAIAAAEAVRGTRLVVDRTRLIPQASPYVWSAERDVARFTLAGSVPLPATWARLLDALRNIAGGTEVSDETAYARGAPPRFEEAAGLLINQVARLSKGKVTLSDRGAKLEGMARDLGAREAIAADLNKLPEGFSVTANTVRAPPYVFQANKDPVAATVTLSGYVPDDSTHRAVVAAAKRKFFNEQVTDNLKVSIGAPSGFGQGVIVALGELSRLSTGALTISDTDVRLAGDVFYDAAVDQIRSELHGGLPQGWKDAADISPKPPASSVDTTVCQQLFAELLAKAKIRFESGQAAIDLDSDGLLDRMIETAMRCPTASIEVGGHTDSDGDAQANLALSERRAQAVVDYMVKAGVASDRLKAVGYGDTQPIASNDTEDGKAQNRRIEFVVR